MTGTDAAGGAEFYLIPRDPEGEYIATAEEIVRAKGLSGFTQSVRPGRFDRSAGESQVLQELQDLLPEAIKLSRENPFLTLRVAESAGLEAGECMCSCGAGPGTCAGGGSGSGHGS